MRRLWIWLVVVLSVTGCGGGTPKEVTDRPVLDSCTQGPVFIPVRQGPAETQTQSQTALDCFLRHHESGDPAELVFTLLGTEGAHHEAILQTLPDGTVSYFTNVGGWRIHQQCRSILVEPVPEVRGCL